MVFFTTPIQQPHHLWQISYSQAYHVQNANTFRNFYVQRIQICLGLGKQII